MYGVTLLHVYLSQTYYTTGKALYSKYSGKVGASTNSLLEINRNDNSLIKDIETIDLNKFELLVTRHTHELEYAMQCEGYVKRNIESA